MRRAAHFQRSGQLIKVSDRIMVLFRGQIMGFVDADNATREALGRMMLGEAH